VAHTEISDGNLVIRMTARETMASGRHQVTVPLAAITDLRIVNDPTAQYSNPLTGEHGWKIIGGQLPGSFAEGTFRSEGQTVFLDVHRGQPALAISLNEGHFQQVVIGTDDPAKLAAELRAAGAA
jgi:hypothetical protein